MPTSSTSRGELAAALRADTGATWDTVAAVAKYVDRSTARRAALAAVDAKEREGERLIEEARRLRAAIRSGGDQR